MFVLRVSCDDMLFLEDVLDYYFRDHHNVKYQDLLHKVLSAEFYNDDYFDIVFSEKKEND